MEPSGHVGPADKVDGLFLPLSVSRLLEMDGWLLLREWQHKRLLKTRIISTWRRARTSVEVRVVSGEKMPRRPLKLPGSQLLVILRLAQQFATLLRC
jgi:hypothetical protein